MTLPLILQADDGLHWWKEPCLLEHSVESPDIDNNIYKVWDSSGQLINLDPVEPVQLGSFFGIKTVSVSAGVLCPSGIDDSEALLSALLFHFKDIHNRLITSPMKLPEAISLFCSLEPESRS